MSLQPGAGAQAALFRADEGGQGRVRGPLLDVHERRAQAGGAHGLGVGGEHSRIGGQQVRRQRRRVQVGQLAARRARVGCARLQRNLRTRYTFFTNIPLLCTA